MSSKKGFIDKKSKAYFWFVYIMSDKLIVLQVVFYLLLCRQNFDLINYGLVIVVLAFAFSEGIKAFVRSPRPENPFLPKQTDTSFPSSHTAASFALSFAYMYYGESMVILLISLLASVLVATGRVLGGAHYTRDVIAGALLAFLVSSVSYYLGLRIYIG